MSLDCLVMTNLVSQFPSRELWQPSVYIFTHLPFCFFFLSNVYINLGVCTHYNQTYKSRFYENLLKFAFFCFFFGSVS